MHAAFAALALASMAAGFLGLLHHGPAPDYRVPAALIVGVVAGLCLAITFAP